MVLRVKIYVLTDKNVLKNVITSMLQKCLRPFAYKLAVHTKREKWVPNLFGILDVFSSVHV